MVSNIQKEPMHLITAKQSAAVSLEQITCWMSNFFSNRSTILLA